MSKTSPWDHLPLTDLSYQVLLCLANGPAHGYAILQRINERTSGRISPDTGTLYTALRRLDRDGLIGHSGEPKTRGRRGRSYDLTEEGRVVLRLESRRLSELVREARELELLDGTEPAPGLTS
ncbi:MAG: PadR family transcriptional regulator [Gemmatimonadota bacterium]